MVPVESCVGCFKVERDFKGSRLSEHLLAWAYEIVLPLSGELPTDSVRFRLQNRQNPRLPSRSDSLKGSLSKLTKVRTEQTAGGRPW